MPVAVKICCIAGVDEARLAISAGASALGLVSAMPSGPGVITDDTAAEVAAAVAAGRCGTPVRTFLLTARTRAAEIAAQHRQVGTTTLQLVDHVPAGELQALRGLCPGIEIVQVIHVAGEHALAEAAAAAPWVDALLLDSGNPTLAVKELGGTGRTHDWALSARICQAAHPLPLWLAGGLRAGNVTEAVQRVAPHGVDLCSGVRRDGRLDAALLADFMAAVGARTAAPL
ncbi:MAG: phosphoribosylanthranilate isomerase [Rubrivivax sp.]|nr:phosphoribosylanthranilate isomerase [Rubrivivax sp.]